MELISELSAEMNKEKLNQSALTPYELVRAYWKKWWEDKGKRSGSYEGFWKAGLNNGVIAGTTFESVSVSLRDGFAKSLPAERKLSQEMEVVFRPDTAVFDGQFANNGWLQELPQPLTPHHLGQRRSRQPQDCQGSWPVHSLWRSRRRAWRGHRGHGDLDR